MGRLAMRYRFSEEGDTYIRAAKREIEIHT